jgi:glycosyltransferase involved in cell wall biosynthesis
LRIRQEKNVEMEKTGTSLRQIAFIGNYLPRQCGIATFTTDLCQAITVQYPETSCFALAVNDTNTGYNYPPTVRFELAEQDLTDYRRAADFLNVNNVDLVCLQHEYGIFGGRAGSHILALLRELRMPVVTTLHTILREPDPQQSQILKEIAHLSERLVVMSQRGSEFLQDIYQVPTDKIDIIPHGIPDIPFVDPNFYKDQFGVEGKQVLLTFGLLSPGKGIEHVINALPTVLHRYPNLVYMILGATHPHVKHHEGEAYRLKLQRLAREIGVDDHVMFHNRFVSLQELVEFIGAADIYLTPYLNPAQIVSGTLAYTLGAGKAVVSTPYWYAEELLGEGRGVLVPFNDPAAIAERVIDLLDNEAERHAMRKRAYLYGREMIWPRVARRYMESFESARQKRAEHIRPVFVAKTLKDHGGDLPQIKLHHLLRLTDSTGLLQHAIYTVPNYAEGYTTDDNSRALLLTVLLEESEAQVSADLDLLASRYMAFVAYAFNPDTGRFRNYMAYDHRWLDDSGPEDSHGRALWALGTIMGRSCNEGLRCLAGRLFGAALAATLEFTSPRAWAYTLLAIREYIQRFSGDRAAQKIGETLAERLMDLYHRTSTPEWPWFEDIVSYDNPRLSQALMVCGQWLDRPDMSDAGLKTLAWLAEIQRAESDHFMPIGNQGFYRRSGEKARFDQQPIEAQAMISACLEAYRMTNDGFWYQAAQRAFEWFLGRNDLGLSLYDPLTGGCRDGLHVDRVNQNQGAESTLAFLLAVTELILGQRLMTPAIDAAVATPTPVGRD